MGLLCKCDHESSPQAHRRKRKILCGQVQSLQKQNNGFCDHRHRLYKKRSTFILEIEGALAYKQTSNADFGTNILYLPAIIKLNKVGKDAVSAA